MVKTGYPHTSNEKAPKFVLFIPTFNVVDRFVGVLEAIPPAILARFVEVLIIDNGSTDGTREALVAWVARRCDCRFRVLFNEQNYSLGGSTIIAFREAIAVGGDFLICMHSDGQADPRALSEFINRANLQVDFLLGDRLAKRSVINDYSAFRLWGNRFFEWLQNLIARQNLGDIGAYIAFNLQTVRRLPYWSLPHDMGYQPLLILVAAQTLNIRLIEFPISWGKADRSNVNPLRYGFTHLLRLICLLFRQVPTTSRVLSEFRTQEIHIPTKMKSLPSVRTHPEKADN